MSVKVFRDTVFVNEVFAIGRGQFSVFMQPQVGATAKEYRIRNNLSSHKNKFDCLVHAN